MSPYRIYYVLAVCFFIAHNCYASGWSSYQRDDSEEVELYGINCSDSIYIETSNTYTNISICGIFFAVLTNGVTSTTRCYFKNLGIDTNILNHATTNITTSTVYSAVGIKTSIEHGDTTTRTLVGEEIMEYHIARAIQERYAVNGTSANYYVYTKTGGRNNILVSKWHTQWLATHWFYDTNQYLSDKVSIFTESNLLVQAGLPTNYFSYTPNKIEYSGPTYGRIMTCGTTIIGGTSDVQIVTNNLILYTGGVARVCGTNGQHVTIIITNNNIMEGFTTESYSITNLITILNKLTAIKWIDSSTMLSKRAEYNCYTDQNDKYTFLAFADAACDHCKPKSYTTVTDTNEVYSNIGCYSYSSNNITTNSLSGLYVFAVANFNSYERSYNKEVKGGIWTDWHKNNISTYKDSDYADFRYSYGATIIQKKSFDKKIIYDLGITKCDVYAGAIISYNTNAYNIYEYDVSAIQDDAYCPGHTSVGSTGSVARTIYENQSSPWISGVNTSSYTYVKSGTAEIGGSESLCYITNICNNFPFPVSDYPQLNYDESFSDGASAGGSCSHEEGFSAEWCSSHGCDVGELTFSESDSVSVYYAWMSRQIASGVHDAYLDFAVTNGFKYY